MIVIFSLFEMLLLRSLVQHAALLISLPSFIYTSRSPLSISSFIRALSAAVSQRSSCRRIALLYDLRVDAAWCICSINFAFV
jgi:hypothetical protein